MLDLGLVWSLAAVAWVIVSFVMAFIDLRFGRFPLLDEATRRIGPSSKRYCLIYKWIRNGEFKVDDPKLVAHVRLMCVLTRITKVLLFIAIAGFLVAIIARKLRIYP